MDIDAITDVVQADDRLPKSSSGLKFELHPVRVHFGFRGDMPPFLA